MRARPGCGSGRVGPAALLRPTPDVPGGEARERMARMLAGAPAFAGRLWVPSPRWCLGLAAWASMVAVGTALVVGSPGLAAGVMAAATTRSIASGEQVAAALETYALEGGSFPVAADAPQLQASLAPFLPRALRLVAPGSGAFAYAPTATSVVLRYTPDSGVPTQVRLTAGSGGTLTAGGTTVPLPW